MPTALDTPDVLLSVVVPTHEVGPWVSDCLKSLLRQNVPGMEIIVIDDHSTDSTLATAASLAASDQRIRLIAADDFGGANARNQGARLARGRYLVFADGDDIVPDEAYARLVESLESSGSEMAIGNFLKFSTKETWEPGRSWNVFNNPTSGLTLRDAPGLIRGRACWNKMFRRQFWEATGIEFPEVSRSNDIVPMTRALTAAQSMDVIPDMVYLYRSRPGNQSMTARADKSSALLSYLTQEMECAALITEYGDRALLNQFSSMFLKADGWVHLTKFLGSRTDQEDTAVLGQASAIVKILFEATPPHIRRSLTPAQKRVFTLFGEGRMDVLALLNGEGGIGSGEPEATIEAFEGLIAATAAVVDALPDQSGLTTDALRARMVRPLLASAPLLDDATLTTLMQAVARYRASWLPVERLPFFPHEREAVLICERGSAADLRLLSSILQRVSATSTTLEADGYRLRVTVEVSGAAVGSQVALRMKRRRSGFEFTTHSIEIRSEDSPITVEFDVDRKELRSTGMWDAHLLVTEQGVNAEVRVLSDRRLAQQPAGRSPRFIVLPIRRVGHALVTELRPHAVIRALRIPRKALQKRRRAKRSASHS